ncbi:solute carrier family 22 member 21 [Plakobranchus ocellatus]|uniref:Solute carrier family 22 member 21 n=1 Tax=Plakobranchus ocellatus TaxID=259542 RepID=A0AAV4BRY2_9GAST|nr:solute carrier family 22 member 21 [Plakobranchus ocellatus]
MQTSAKSAYNPVGQFTRKMATIEDIYDHIGGLGKFQLVAIVSLYGMMAIFAYSMLLVGYTGYIGTFECITHYEFNQSATRFYTAAPFNMAATAPDVEDRTAVNVCSVNGTKCQDFKFLESKKTAVSEWHLVCDHLWLKAAITSMQMFGVMLGSVAGGLCGDYFGRKKTIYGSLFLHAVLNVMAAFSVCWRMFCGMRFLIGIALGIGYIMAIPYPTEFLPMRWRHILPAVPVWQFGVMVMAAVAWWLEDWSHLHIACALLCLIFMAGCLNIPESPRWLATQGKLDESYAVLEKIARTNKKRLPPGVKEILQKIATKNTGHERGRTYTYLDLFKGTKNIKLTLIFVLQWFTLAVIYYGIHFSVNSFVGNLYLNIFLMNVVQLPCCLIIAPLTDRLGRRLTSVIFMSILVIVSFACVVLHVSATEHIRDLWISRLCVLASFLVYCGWAVSSVWVTEIYPTVIRSLGYALAALGSRVGSALAPFLLNLVSNFPTYSKGSIEPRLSSFHSSRKLKRVATLTMKWDQN